MTNDNTQLLVAALAVLLAVPSAHAASLDAIIQESSGIVFGEPIGGVLKVKRILNGEAPLPGEVMRVKGLKGGFDEVFFLYRSASGAYVLRGSGPKTLIPSIQAALLVKPALRRKTPGEDSSTLREQVESARIIVYGEVLATFRTTAGNVGATVWTGQILVHRTYKGRLTPPRVVMDLRVDIGIATAPDMISHTTRWTKGSLWVWMLGKTENGRYMVQAAVPDHLQEAARLLAIKGQKPGKNILADFDRKRMKEVNPDKPILVSPPAREGRPFTLPGGLKVNAAPGIVHFGLRPDITIPEAKALVEFLQQPGFRLDKFDGAAAGSLLVAPDATLETFEYLHVLPGVAFANLDILQERKEPIMTPSRLDLGGPGEPIEGE